MNEQNYNQDFQQQSGQPFGQQAPQGQPFGQQAPQGQPYGQQAPQGQPYGQQAPQGQPFGQQAPQGQPYGQQAPQGQPFGQQAPQGQPFGQQAPQGQPFGQQAPQGQPFGQQAPQGQPFGQQAPQGQMTMKKPMKIGWIIALALFVLSFVGVSIGGVLTVSNSPASIVSTIDSRLENYSDGQEGFISDSNLKATTDGFKYSGLTKGKAYVFVFLQTGGDLIENITIDNQSAHPFYSDYTNSKKINSKTITNCRYYYVVAQGSEMEFKISNIDGTSGRVALSDSKDLTSKFETLLTGTVLLLVFGIAATVTFIAFVAFLMIYLMKNNKYKSAQHFNY